MMTNNAYLQYLLVANGLQSESLFERLLRKIFNYKKYFKNYGSATDHLATIFKNPGNYSREIVVLIAALFLAFLILLLTIVLLITIKRRLKIRSAYNSVKVKLTEKQLFHYLAAICLALTVLLALFTANAVVPSFCNSCHIINKPYNQWKGSAHHNISCVGCHYKPGAYGYAIGAFNGCENLIAFIFKPPAPMQPAVSNNTCLSCHNDIENRIVSGDRQILVKHKEIIQAGILCTSCHTSIAHKQNKTVFIMNTCARCHNGNQASSRCSLCHQQDIAYNSHMALDDWPKVKNPKIICTGCHKAATDRACDKCHGLEIPHPAEFRKSHALQSEIGNGLCYKCHWKTMSKNTPCACHKEGTIHGDPEEWYLKHRAVARMKGMSCRCHTIAYCGNCHDDPSSIYPQNKIGGPLGGMR